MTSITPPNRPRFIVFTEIMGLQKGEYVPCPLGKFPLMNKGELSQRARHIFSLLQPNYLCEYDESGAIGRRYRRHDELGTPCCITIDFETLENETVTVRDRDSMQQVRISQEHLLSYLQKQMHS